MPQLLLVSVLLLSSGRLSAGDVDVSFILDNAAKATGIEALVNIEESANDDTCFPGLVDGAILKIEYAPGGKRLAGMLVRVPKSADFEAGDLFFNVDGDRLNASLDARTIALLPTLFKIGTPVTMSYQQCGASGRFLSVRDIYLRRTSAPTTSMYRPTRFLVLFALPPGEADRVGTARKEVVALWPIPMSEKDDGFLACTWASVKFDNAKARALHTSKLRDLIAPEVINPLLQDKEEASFARKAVLRTEQQIAELPRWTYHADCFESESKESLRSLLEGAVKTTKTKKD